MLGFMNGIQPLAGMGMDFASGFSALSPLMSMSNLTTIFTSPATQNADGGMSWGGMSAGNAFAQMSGGMFGYMGGTDGPAQAIFRMPIYQDRYEQKAVYEYTEHKAWDYKFQTGQKVHQTEQTASQRIEILPNRDPVILDLNEDGELGVTGADNSQRRINEKQTSTNSVAVSGDRRITTTTTQKEWDLLVNWDKKIDFDVNGDGSTDRTEWLKKGGGDGFLVMDADGDGKINGRELMNETGLDGEQNKYQSGWDKVRSLFDGNDDGVLEGDELKSLKIWADENGDGKTDAGELKSLDELGIVKIDTQTGSFTKKKLVGYETIHHRDEIGYVEHGTYAGSNTYGVGSRMVIGGQVLQDFQLGC